MHNQKFEYKQLEIIIDTFRQPPAKIALIIIHDDKRYFSLLMYVELHNRTESDSRTSSSRYL